MINKYPVISLSRNHNKIIFLSLIAVIVALTFITASKSKQINELKTLNILQKRNLDSINLAFESLKHSAIEMEEYYDSTYNIIFPDYLKAQFEEAYDIKNPKYFVDSALRTRIISIPFSGSRGSAMDFDDIVVLNHRWVYCYVEDGHYGGYLLYEYSINDKKAIQFKLIGKTLMDIPE